MQTNKSKDSLLWTKVKLGDSNALNKLYDEYIDLLYAFGIKYIDDKDCVKDCIHDLFLDLYKYRKNLSDVDNIKQYLFTSLKRNIYKKSKSNQKVFSLDSKEYNIESNDESIEETIVKSEKVLEVKANLSRAITSLTNRQQKSLSLKFTEERSYEEIATILDISIESVRTLIYRSLKKLRNEIKIE